MMAKICFLFQLVFLSQEVNFNMLNVGRDGLLKSVEQLISEIFIPALQTMDCGWVEFSEPQQASNIKKDFLGSLEAFVSVLSGTQQSLLEKVVCSCGNEKLS